VKTKVDSPENNKNILNSSHKRAAKYEDDNVVRPKHLILCISNENLPFIDSNHDSPGCSRRHHHHHHHANERVIQMMPRNLIIPGGAIEKSHGKDWERFTAMQQKLSTHKYIEIDVMDSQICQKCHKVLSFKKTFKCSLCDFTCHQHCAADKVRHINIRGVQTKERTDERYCHLSWVMILKND
jgi:hypothetical protein